MKWKKQVLLCHLKNDAYAYAGKGGPSLGNASVVSIMLEEEKISKTKLKAKESDLQNLLSAIESEKLPS